MTPDERLICPQCGKPYIDRACGPTHAVIGGQVSRAPDLDRELANARRELRDARVENERQAEMARSINCDLVEERDMLAARLVEVEKERDEQRKLMPLIEREAQLASAEARGRRA